MRSKLFIVSLLLIAASNAQAYLDPGTGSAILQGIIGALAAIGITLKLYWHRVLRFLGIRKSNNFREDDQSPNPTHTDASRPDSRRD